MFSGLAMEGLTQYLVFSGGGTRVCSRFQLMPFPRRQNPLSPIGELSKSLLHISLLSSRSVYPTACWTFLPECPPVTSNLTCLKLISFSYTDWWTATHNQTFAQARNLEVLHFFVSLTSHIWLLLNSYYIIFPLDCCTGFLTGLTFSPVLLRERLNR